MFEFAVNFIMYALIPSPRLIDKVMEDEGSTVPLVSVSFNITSNGDSFGTCITTLPFLCLHI